MGRSFLFASLLIIIAATGYAQTPANRGVLTGVVQDQAGAAIVGARVELSGGGVPPQSVTTDQSGGFRFTRIHAQVREDDLVKLRFDVPGHGDITIWGNVAYWVRDTGFGVRFSAFSQGGARDRLAAILNEEAHRS